MAVSKEKIKDAICDCDIELTWDNWVKIFKAIDACADEPATAPSASWLVDSWDNETDPGKVAMIVRCPKCGKEMRICAHLGDEPLHEVLGECKDCDLNATWFVRVDTKNRVLSETDFKLFRFC